MGSNKQEKWLKELKNSVQNYTEPLPDDFWEGIQKNIPASPPRKGVWGKMVWITSAAAVLLLAVLLVWPQPEESAGLAVTVLEEPAAGRKLESVVEEVVEKNLKDIEKAVVYDNTVKMNEEGDVIVRNVDGKVVEEKVVEESYREENEIVENGYREEEDIEDRDEMKKRERLEYLKELEYLGQDIGKTGKRRNMLAFAAGTVGVPTYFTNPVYMDNFIGSDAFPSQGMNSGTVTFPVEMDNVAGFLNIGALPAENISWLGDNGPNAIIKKSLQSLKSYSYNHNEPVKLGILFAREVARGFFIESGISYQYLKSRMGEDMDLHLQKLHYLGIPARLRLDIVNTGEFSAYISGGYLLEKCIYGVVERKYEDDFRVHIRKWQNSINANVGAQLSIGGGAAIYIEPGMYKYLGMKDKELTRQSGYILQSIYTEEPLGFSVQGGLRFSF